MDDKELIEDLLHTIEHMKEIKEVDVVKEKLENELIDIINKFRDMKLEYRFKLIFEFYLKIFEIKEKNK